MAGLGDLESRIMAVLWDTDAPCTVREVHASLQAERTLAYTTVMTVLDNLHTKEWVVRERDGRAWSYRPARAREEAGAQMLRDLLTSLGDPRGVLMSFARDMSSEESAFLRQALDETGTEERGRSRRKPKRS
ncbi:BlaI/MecI/CopY family transcriptional regulator [Amycolatopsis sp. NPDC058340]|uniref:BlaI/MecI/CopY family transcriptional regulator n=1 Tax=Amycolatopsis sp. NPDC058340 TaxID=3346453 RepID=UPI0036561602